MRACTDEITVWYDQGWVGGGGAVGVGRLTDFVFLPCPYCFNFSWHVVGA